MPIKFNDYIRNVNSSYPLIRGEDNEISGIGYFTDLSGRYNLPAPKRVNSYVAIVSNNSESEVYQFIGDINILGEWEDTKFWDLLANSSNMMALFLRGVAKLIGPTHTVLFPNGVEGDFNQDGTVDIKDFLEYLFSYGTSSGYPDKTVTIGDGSLSPNGTPRSTNQRVTSRVGSTVTREDYIASYEYDNYEAQSDYQLVTSRKLGDLIATTSPTLANANQVIISERSIDLGTFGLKYTKYDGSDVFKINANSGYAEFSKRLSVKGSATVAAKFYLYEATNNGTGYVSLKAPDNLTNSSFTLTLPGSDGSAGDIMQTDGAGNLSLASPSHENITNTNLGLTGSRLIELNSNVLMFTEGGVPSIALTSSQLMVPNFLNITNNQVSLGSSLQLAEATVSGINTVKISAPSSIVSSYTLNLPSADGSAGQAIITDGIGNLSFATVGGGGGGSGLSSVMAYGGRLQNTTSQGNSMIICGGAFGPTYYFWASTAGLTPSGGGVVDSTTFTLSAMYQHFGGIRIPDNKQVRVDILARPFDGNGINLPYYVMLWEFAPSINSATGPTCTLRAKAQVLSPTSISYDFSATCASVTPFTKGNFALVTFGMSNQTLFATAYQYLNVYLSLQ